MCALILKLWLELSNHVFCCLVARALSRKIARVLKIIESPLKLGKSYKQAHFIGNRICVLSPDVVVDSLFLTVS